MTFAADRSMLRLHLARLRWKNEPRLCGNVTKKKILGCSGCCEKETADLTPVSVVCRPPWNNQAVDGSQLRRLNLSSAEVLKGFYFIFYCFVFWLHWTEAVESVTWRTLRVTLFDSKECALPRACFVFPVGSSRWPVVAAARCEVRLSAFYVYSLFFFFDFFFVPSRRHFVTAAFPSTGGCWNFHRWLHAVHQSPPSLLHHWAGTQPSPEKLIQKENEIKNRQGEKPLSYSLKTISSLGLFLSPSNKRSCFKMPSSIT